MTTPNWNTFHRTCARKQWWKSERRKYPKGNTNARKFSHRTDTDSHDKWKNRTTNNGLSAAATLMLCEPDRPIVTAEHALKLITSVQELQFRYLIRQSCRLDYRELKKKSSKPRRVFTRWNWFRIGRRYPRKHSIKGTCFRYIRTDNNNSGKSEQTF